MEKQVEKLIWINTLCYLSYFLYSFVESKREITGFWVIVAFIPHLLVIISSFFVLNNRKYKFRILLKEAILDWVIRVLAFFLNFRITLINKFSPIFYIMMVGMFLFLIINILLEIDMYKKTMNENILEEKKKWYDFSFQERENYNDMYSSVTKSFFEIPILIIIITIFLGFDNKSSISSIIGLGIFSLGLICFFINSSYKTLDMFYKNKELTKKHFIKENTYVAISILFGGIFAISRSLGYGETLEFILFIVQISILYPNFKARSERARRVLEMKKLKD
jgi:hypothetical protein